MKHNQPRTTEAATAMLARHAAIEDQVATINATRDAAIAAANKTADADLLPLLSEITLIQEKLAPWWTKAKDKILSGKRKSIELGGCEIGSRKAKDKLGYAGKHDKPVKALTGLRWAKSMLRVTVSIDAAATMKALGGHHGDKLKELGFKKVPGEDEFFVKRAEQKGTVDKVQS